MNKKCFMIVFLFAVLLGAIFASSFGAMEPPLLQGKNLSPLLIDSERLDWHKVAIRDFLAEQERIFIPAEQKVGFKSSSYIKFVLRDSKLPCFLYKYDRAGLEHYKEIQRGDRITVIGTLERLGKGAERYYNPKFVMRIDDIRKGWNPREGESILEKDGPAGQISYQEVDPEALAGLPEEFDGKYIAIRDRFSLLSGYYTNFEKDLDLSGETAIKFRGELLPWPCYIPQTKENLELITHLKTGERITITGKLMVLPLADDHLVLVAVHRVKEGWN